ncbi:hypothetical protein [Methanosarcina siciliae]|uniref:hypothetical protein n=1 Tax=Methanosarcina siciliae TaxID=38027 RepID=UPI000A9DE719|nr:hypothetical protein [Methanosarcina siciliae]
MKETENTITGATKLRVYNPQRKTGMFYIGTEDFNELRKYLEGKDLTYRLDKEKGELCIRETQYPE